MTKGNACKIYPTPLGYGQVFVNGRKVYAHLICAEYFLGPKPEGFDVNHKDCNKLNNSKDNLEYISHSDNKRHHFRVDDYGPRGGRKSKIKGTHGYYSNIRIDGHYVYLGYYPNIEMAQGAYYMAYEMIFGIPPWDGR